MDISLFDFDLPEDRIALRPVSPRDHARQLIVRPNGPEPVLVDDHVYNLVDHVRAGDVMVFNDTKVIPSRLYGAVGSARVEVTLHRRAGLVDWWSFIKNGRRADIGKIIDFGGDLSARVIEKLPDGQVLIRLILPPSMNAEQALVAYGAMPLPPYIASKRPVDGQDAQDYQTVYAKREGAVAAPTAGLHFTSELLDRLVAKGVRMVYVTLHVGAGTFLPVKVQDTKDHVMHAEWGEMTPENATVLNACRAAGGRIMAVGTTSLRLLETAADESGVIQPFIGETSIFITPGYRFRAVDMLMTNFHLPKSTLFMLVSAFAGLPMMRDAYTHAIAHGYRFYSYGDSSLLYRAH
jgi:S-adenosylmethionine:tRNA ribosyltransferase-isomerase